MSDVERATVKAGADIVEPASHVTGVVSMVYPVCRVRSVTLTQIAARQPVAAQEILRDHRAEHRAGDAPQEAAGHDAAEAGAASGNAAEQPFHRAGLAHFRARRELRERLENSLKTGKPMRVMHIAEILAGHPV